MAVMLVLLKEGFYDICRWNGLRWHDIHTMFHDDWFRHLSNITVIIGTIWEAIILVLLIEGIYEMRCWDGFMWRDIYIKFHEDWYRHSRNIKVLPQIEALMLVLLIGGIYKLRRWDGLKCHDIHTKFHKDLYSHLKVMGDKPTDTQTARWPHNRTFIFQNKESRLKIKWNGFDSKRSCHRQGINLEGLRTRTERYH
jgi:hypothetical protein